MAKARSVEAERSPKGSGKGKGVGPALHLRQAIDIAGAIEGVVHVKREVDPLIEVPNVMRAMGSIKPVPAVIFDNVKGYPGKRIVGNLFAERRRFSEMCGFPEEREMTKFGFLNALDNPILPVTVKSGACQETVIQGPVEVEKHIPPTHGALKVTRRYYQPTVFIKHPKTGALNVSLYRACIQPDGRITINIRWDQHGGLYLKQAIELGQPLQLALCLGVPPAVYMAAVTKLPYGCEEMGFAGGVFGQPAEMIPCKTIDVEVPASSEFVIEGEIRPPYARGDDGPWPEYLNYLGMEIHPPIMDVTCVTHRNNPILNMQIPGSVPHMLGVGTGAQVFRFLRSIFGEFIVDTHLLPRSSFHNLVVKVDKSEAHHEGLQMNVALAAFGLTNYMDKVTVVDKDINIYDLYEVEWAMITRCNPTAPDSHFARGQDPSEQPHRRCSGDLRQAPHQGQARRGRHHSLERAQRVQGRGNQLLYPERMGAVQRGRLSRARGSPAIPGQEVAFLYIANRKGPRD